MPRLPFSREPSKKPVHFARPAALDDRYTVFYRRHLAFVRRFVQSLYVHASYLDDIVQEVFLVCHRQEVFPSSDGAARAWLSACVFRVVSNHRRRMHFRVECSYQDSLAPAITPRWDEELDAIRLLSGALAQVGPKQRDVYILAKVHQVPVVEIAKRLGVKRLSVYAMLCEAQKGMSYWIRTRLMQR